MVLLSMFFFFLSGLFCGAARPTLGEGIVELPRGDPVTGWCEL